MFGEGSPAVLEMVPNSFLYPVAMLGLLLGTSVALASGFEWFGITGVLLLSLLSLLCGGF